MTVRMAQVSVHVQQALVRRYFTLRGVDPQARRALFWFKPPKGHAFKDDVVWLDQKTSGVDARSMIGNRKLPMQGWLDLLARHNIGILNEFATTMMQLAHENLKRKKPVKLQAVIPYGMGLKPAEYELLAKSFDATVLVPYSSKEGGLMAFACGQDGHFHICAEAVVCEYETVSDAIDEEKNIIITPLYSSAQPLIRYRHGDLVVRGTTCRCGIKLPVLKRIVGRADDVFILSGQRVPVVGINDEMVIKHLKATAFQIAQIGADALQVRFVSRRNASAAARSVLTRHIRRALACQAQVTYSRLETLPLTTGGKQRRFIRE